MVKEGVINQWVVVEFILNKSLGYRYRVYLHFYCLWCSLTFDIVVTVHVKCLAHAHMFQTHDENLKYARNTWTFSVMVVKCGEFVEPVTATLNILH